MSAKNLNICITVLLASVISSSVEAQTQNNQNSFYNPSQTPAQPTEPGLTNPSGSTVFTPNAPPRTLGATPPPTAGNNNATINGTITPNTGVNSSVGTSTPDMNSNPSLNTGPSSGIAGTTTTGSTGTGSTGTTGGTAGSTSSGSSAAGTGGGSAGGSGGAGGGGMR